MRTSRNLRKAVLEAESNVSVVAFIGSVERGKEHLTEHRNIDLKFSDIQLVEGSDFETYASPKTMMPFLFCAVNSEYALQVFENFGIEYILKFFTSDAVAASQRVSELSTQQQHKQHPWYGDFFRLLKNQLRPVSVPTIILYQRDKIIPLEGEKIALFFIENDIVYALTFDEKKMGTHYKLNALEQKFSPYFFRANRQYLINRKVIKEASQCFHRKLIIHLNISFNRSILVGKEKATAFLDWLSST